MSKFVHLLWLGVRLPVCSARFRDFVVVMFRSVWAIFTRGQNMGSNIPWIVIRWLRRPILQRTCRIREFSRRCCGCDSRGLGRRIGILLQIFGQAKVWGILSYYVWTKWMLQEYHYIVSYPLVLADGSSHFAELQHGTFSPLLIDYYWRPLSMACFKNRQVYKQANVLD